MAPCPKEGRGCGCAQSTGWSVEREPGHLVPTALMWTSHLDCRATLPLFSDQFQQRFLLPPSSHTASPPCSEKLQAAVSPGPLLQLTGAPRTHPCSSSGLIFSIPVGGTFTFLQRESSGGPSLVLAETNCVPLPVSSASHAHV